MTRGLHRLAAAGLGVLGVVLLWGPVRACINLYSENLKGERVSLGGRSAEHYVANLTGHSHGAEEWNSKQATLERELKEKPGDFKLRADIAATHVFEGEIKEAVSELEKLEAEKPGEYVVAGNLGTAYELDGQNAKALEWIKTGIERNADSHEGTEWLHVKILEAKLALEKDAAWLGTHSVLGMDFGSAAEPVIPQSGPVDHLGKTRSIADTVKALEYQLHERTAFVKPPDPVVADLLHSLACLAAETKTVNHGAALMSAALEYQGQSPELMVQRRDYFAGRAETATVDEADVPIKKVLFGLGVLAAEFIVACIVVILILRALLRRRTAKA